MGFRSEYCGELLTQKGFWAYYAFETARDMLLKKDPRTINILSSADLFQLSKLFPEIRFRKNRKEHAYLIQNGNPVRFYISNYPADRSVRIPGLIEGEKDALRYAVKSELFRINSFFYNIKRKIYHDPLDAYFQLKNGIIQTIVPPEKAGKSFPLIALQTAKIFCETNFEIDDELCAYLNHQTSLKVYEAIDDEMISYFTDIIVSKRAYKALALLNDWGVLDILLPEVTRLQLVHQDKDHHPEGNAFRHTLQCMKFVKKPNKNLMMAILLHDTGKATTMSMRTENRFPNHAYESKVISRDILRRFHFEGRDRDEILFLVDNHMILNGVDRLPQHVLRKIFTSPYFPNLLELYRADIESGYHEIYDYYHAAKVYRNFMKKQKLRVFLYH